MDSNPKHGFNTLQVHGGHHEDPLGAVNVPIYLSSTFAFKNAAHGASLFAGDSDGFILHSIANPTIRPERTVAEMEGGFDGIATSSEWARCPPSTWRCWPRTRR